MPLLTCTFRCPDDVPGDEVHAAAMSFVFRDPVDLATWHVTSDIQCQGVAYVVQPQDVHCEAEGLPEPNGLLAALVLLAVLVRWRT